MVPSLYLSFSITGVKTSTESKEGKDAAELCEGDFSATGIKATRGMDAILATDADCVIFAQRVALSDPTIPDSPSSAWVSDLEALLASGKNDIEMQNCPSRKCYSTRGRCRQKVSGNNASPLDITLARFSSWRVGFF